MAKKKTAINWDAVHQVYRLGAYTLDNIGQMFGCKACTIHNHAKAHGWSKDRQRAVHAKTQALLENEVAKNTALTKMGGEVEPHEKAHDNIELNGPAMDGVSGEEGSVLASPCINAEHTHTAALDSPDELVDAAARQHVEVIRSHARHLVRAQANLEMLFAELFAGTMNRAEIEQAIRDITAQDDNRKREYALMRLTALPQRAQAMKQLSAALRDLVLLERKTFSLDAATDGGGGHEPGMPIEERLRRYARQEAIEEAGDKVVELPQRPG